MLSRRIIALGVFYYHQLVTRNDIFEKSHNLAYGQSATQKYQDLVDELLEDDDTAEDAFEDVSIGTVCAFSKDGPILSIFEQNHHHRKKENQ